MFQLTISFVNHFKLGEFDEKLSHQYFLQRGS